MSAALGAPVLIVEFAKAFQTARGDRRRFEAWQKAGGGQLSWQLVSGVEGYDLRHVAGAPRRDVAFEDRLERVLGLEGRGFR
jgi:hypothetical protein